MNGRPAPPPGWSWSTYEDCVVHQEHPATGPRRVMVRSSFKEQKNGALHLTVVVDCAWQDEVLQAASGATWGIDIMCPNASQHDTATFKHPGPLYPAWRAVGRAAVWVAVLLREALHTTLTQGFWAAHLRWNRLKRGRRPRSTGS